MIYLGDYETTICFMKNKIIKKGNNFSSFRDIGPV